MSHWQTHQLAELLEQSGLQAAPGQIWQSIRLVPLLQAQPCLDLRLHRERNTADLSIVEVEDKLDYISYIPHAFVLNWLPDGIAETALGTQLSRKHKEGKKYKKLPIKIFERLAKKRQARQLRFLPQHLGIELYLHQFFNAPAIDWRDTYRRSAISEGLLPRSIWMMEGCMIEGFKDALRLFEHHAHQVGFLLFVADALAAVQIYPNPQDYQALYRSILQDMFGDIFWYYSRYPNPVPELKITTPTQAQNWHELRADLNRQRGEMASFEHSMAAGLFDQPVRSQKVQGLGPYRLNRFVSVLEPEKTTEAHLGEFIADQAGKLVYLKTTRLSQAQIEQAWILEQLDQHLWHLDSTAQKLNLSQDQLIFKLIKLNLGHLLKPQLIDQALKRQRERLQAHKKQLES